MNQHHYIDQHYDILMAKYVRGYMYKNGVYRMEVNTPNYEGYVEWPAEYALNEHGVKYIRRLPGPPLWVLWPKNDNFLFDFLKRQKTACPNSTSSSPPTAQLPAVADQPHPTQPPAESGQ